MNNFSKSCYTVIKNFLSKDDVDELLCDYRTSATNNPNGWQLFPASKQILKKHKSKILDVCKQTGLDVDLLTTFAIYTDTSWTNWDWHQDHESFYFFQQHQNYLNFYIIIEKEDQSLSGLSVVPMDRLQEVVPEFMHKIINCGARRFFPAENSTQVHCDETGEEFVLPVNIDTIAEHPALDAGDLLLIRGDVIHQTQDNLKSRIAVSIRCTQGSAIISKEKLLSGCDAKTKLLEISGDRYLFCLNKFKNKNIITARDLSDEEK